jgi:hypothetical protein
VEGARGRIVTERSAASAGHAAELVLHWRTLRERLDSQIRHLENQLRGFRWALAAAVGGDAVERCYERLLRLRRVRAKVASRERFESSALPQSADRGDLRRA